MRQAMSRVLLTGSAGAVGCAVGRELIRRGHLVRGLDRVPSEGLAEAMVGNVADPTAVSAAIRGCDCVVHLAAHPDDAPFLEVLLEPNVVGLFTVMNAAREAGVRRVVLASSIQVVGLRGDELARPIPVTEASPGNHYALTKLWAEELGALYARRFAMSVLIVRLGWMVRNAREAAHMQRCQRHDLYLSPAEAGRFFALAVEAESIDFAVVYAVSAAGAARFDLEPARRLLGFEPRDRWPKGLDFEVPAEASTPPS